MRTSWYAPALVSLALSIAATAHAQRPTPEEVGDADSFGRSQTYLGVVSVASVFLQNDCTPDPDFPLPPGSRCITLLPQPQLTFFTEANLGEIRLPSRATRSLICFSITPFFTFDFSNETAERQNAALRARALVTIESEVLKNPQLIDPATGLPYGGRMTLPFGIFNQSRSIDPGEQELKVIQQSRDCVGGLINRSALLALGLSEAQANEFFRRPLRLELGTAGSASMLGGASLFYGMRLYGDR